MGWGVLNRRRWVQTWRRLRYRSHMYRSLLPYDRLLYLGLAAFGTKKYMGLAALGTKMYQGQPALRYRVVPRADSPWSKNVHRASCPGYKNVPRAACPRYTRACRIWPRRNRHVGSWTHNITKLTSHVTTAFLFYLTTKTGILTLKYTHFVI